MAEASLQRMLLQKQRSFLGTVQEPCANDAGENDDFEELNKISDEAQKEKKIPMLIHKIWWQGLKELPEKYKKPLDTWRSINPEWKIIVWDEKSIYRLMHNHYPEYVDLLNSYKYMIQKIDAAKYFILEHFGGMYSDMDQFCINAIDKICDPETETAEMIVSKLTENSKTITWLSSAFSFQHGPYCNNAFCITKPKSRAWEEIRRALVESSEVSSYNVKETEVLYTTGPVMFTSGIRHAIEFHHKLKHKNKDLKKAESGPKLENNELIRIIDSKYIDPFSIYFKLGKEKHFEMLIESILKEDEALCISYMDSAWTDAKTAWYDKIVQPIIHYKHQKLFDQMLKRIEKKEKEEKSRKESFLKQASA